MKKVIFICLLCPMLALAQKEIKPSVSKAETALQKGAFDEAKAIIDATVASQEYMVDKKGNPAKSASKAWYLKGLIYAGIDTTKVEKFKSLEADPFKVAKEAFAKAEEIDKGKNESLVNRIYFGQALPMTKQEVGAHLAQAYLNRGYETYKKKDYKKAFVDVEKVLFFLPNDTTQLMNVGVYFAPQADETEKAIDYINKYITAGGKNPDAFLQLYSIYSQRKNYDEALKAIQKLTAIYPNNLDYLNNEYNIYVQTNKLPEAKALMIKRAQAAPKDTEPRYFLALISKKMGQEAEAKQWIVEILKIDADNFDANEEMVGALGREARVLNDERNASKDPKKRLELFNDRHAKLKEALPYAEKCVSIKSSDEGSLYNLLSLYDNLSTYDESYEKKGTELKKKMKALGLQVD